MNKLFSILIILFFLISCNQKKQNIQYDKNFYIGFTPSNTTYIIKVNKEGILKKSGLEIINEYLNDKDKNFISKNKFTVPYNINILLKDKSLQSFVAVGVSSKFDSIFNDKETTYNQVDIYKSQFKNKNYYGFRKNKNVFVSNRRIILENMIRKNKNKPDSNLLKTINLTDSGSEMNIIQINKNLSKDNFNNSLLKIKPNNISDYEAFDIVDATKDIYTGIANKKNKLLNIFQNIETLDNEVYRLIPTGFSLLSRFSTDDYTTFKSNLEQVFEKEFIPNTQQTELFKNIQYLTIFKENYNFAIILHSNDTKTFLTTINKEGEYLSHPIYKLQNSNLIYKRFKNILSEFNSNFLTVIDNDIIITKNKNYLKNIIQNIENGNTLLKQKSFQKLIDLLPENQHIVNILKSKNRYFFKSYYNDNDNIYITMISKKFEKNKTSDIEQVLTYQMNDVPVIKPQLVYNHKNKTYRIIYQNNNNELIYMDMSGKILWKKPFNERIIGTIVPVDIYRNHKIQYAFVTKNNWYIIDRYGRDIDNFPKKINNITKGISVFDYDKNRKYRFGITRKNKFVLYDNQGNEVKGFKVKTKSEIAFSPQHFRIDNKDFIEIQEKSGKLNLLDRRGNVRIKTKEKFENLKQDWGIWNKKFINFDDNKIISIDLKGKVKTEKIDFDNLLGYTAKDNHIVTVSDEKLLIDKKTYNIDLGKYSSPYVFKDNENNKYIFLSDNENHKIYAYNIVGKPITHFPVVGEKILDIKELNKNKYLLVYDSEHNLMIYKF